MPAVNSTMVASKGRPRVRRRGRQSAAGWPMIVNASGPPMSTPMLSPNHQVNQAAVSLDAGSAALHHKAAVATLALTTQATSAPSTPALRMSRGTCSTKGCCTKRCTNAAPIQACKVVPKASTRGSGNSAQPVCP